MCLTVGGVGCTFALQTITRRIARKRAHRDAAGRTSEERERAAKYRGKRIVTLSREDSERGYNLSLSSSLSLFFLFLAASSRATAAADGSDYRMDHLDEVIRDFRNLSGFVSVRRFHGSFYRDYFA